MDRGINFGVRDPIASSPINFPGAPSVDAGRHDNRWIAYETPPDLTVVDSQMRTTTRLQPPTTSGTFPELVLALQLHTNGVSRSTLMPGLLFRTADQRFAKHR
jgi:hypothetical protein